MLTFIIQAVRMGMSFLFGSTGETITEKAGHLNLGIPGIMCVGAASGCVAEAVYTNAVGGFENVSPILSVLIPIIATFLGGAILGLLFSFLTVTLRANQNVTGLALTTFGIGVSTYMIAQVKSVSYANANRYFTAGLPFAKDLGWFGEVFFSYGTMVYLAIALALLTSFVFKRTKVGLRLRAVGENPATADAAGINVTVYRYGATCIGSGVAALGGLCYIMDNLYGNWEYTTDAIGWLAIALVIFTIWRPNIGIIGSIIFGALYVAPNYIPGVAFAHKALIKMLPYVVTVIVLIVTSIRNKRENQPPANLGLSYFREER